MVVRNSTFAVILALILLTLSTGPAASAATSVLTRQNDNSRTGANLSETLLNPTTVASSAFGKLWSYTVNGSVLAQPLYVQYLSVPGHGLRNVLFVVTMNDIVYAFDADSNSLLWSVDLTGGVSGITPVPIKNVVSNPGNIVGNVGIESTPVIDLATHTMYLVSRTLEVYQLPPGNPADSSCGYVVTTNGLASLIYYYCYKLHALDLATGTEKFGGPVVISGTYSAGGSPQLTFNSLYQEQRVGLALANGQIYIAFGSQEDQQTTIYHGWVMSYSASTLGQTGVFCATPNAQQGGIWMSGRAPAIDATGNVYYMVGNSNGSRRLDSTDFTESLLKFPATGPLFPMDWFTPSPYQSWDNSDEDFGSSGPMLIPGTDFVIAGGKSSTFYVLHTNPLVPAGEHEVSGDVQVVQSWNNNGGEVKSGPVFWNHSGGLGPTMYDWSAGGDALKAYQLETTSPPFNVTPGSRSSILLAAPDHGAALALSANGATAGTGVVWATYSTNGSDGNFGTPSTLSAFNADNLTFPLYTDTAVGNWSKFSPPTVANGRVYVASVPADGISQTNVNVYGLSNVHYPSPAAVLAPVIATLLQ